MEKNLQQLLEEQAGQHRQTLYSPTEETRAKLRDANLGRKHSPEHRVKIGAKAKGRVNTDEVKAKMSEAHKQRWADPELHDKMSAIHKQRWATNPVEFTPEHREAIRQSLLKRGAERREAGLAYVAPKRTATMSWDDPKQKAKRIEYMEGKSRGGCAIVTPDGTFDTVTQAAESLSITRQTLYNKLKRYPNQYYYLDVSKD